MRDMVEIELCICATTERAAKIAGRLRGRTTYQFYVNVCPVMGQFQVMVGTLRERTTKKALTEMLLAELAGQLAAE